MNILRYYLSPTDEAYEKITGELLRAPEFYVVATPNTSPEDWERRNYAVYISERHLLLFKERSDAEDFARLHDCLAGDRPMVSALTAPKVGALSRKCRERDWIDAVRCYVKLPLFVCIPPERFPSGQTGSTPVPSGTPDSISEKAKQILDCAENAARSKLDPSGTFKNIHAMVAKLLTDSGISYDKADEMLGLPAGVTSQFCINVTDYSVARKIAEQYLGLFGLTEYLYQFKTQVAGIAAELTASGVDLHVIKQAVSTTQEPFELRSVRRGKDVTGAYVYKLILQSRWRSLTEIVSTPLGYVEGRKYSIGGIEPMPASDDGPSDDQIALVMDDIAKRQHIRQYNGLSAADKAEQPFAQLAPALMEEHAKQRKNDIIRYMRQNLGFSSKDAEAKMAALYWEEDLLEEYWNYIRNGKAPKIKVRGYTAGTLMKELHFNPYEAYCQMVALRRNPKETEQMLKYRKTDPQYQKSPGKA